MLRIEMLPARWAASTCRCDRNSHLPPSARVITTSAKCLFNLRKTLVQTGSEQTIEVILAATTQVLKENVTASTDRIDQCC